MPCPLDHRTLRYVNIIPVCALKRETPWHTRKEGEFLGEGLINKSMPSSCKTCEVTMAGRALPACSISKLKKWFSPLAMKDISRGLEHLWARNKSVLRLFIVRDCKTITPLFQMMQENTDARGRESACICAFLHFCFLCVPLLRCTCLKKWCCYLLNFKGRGLGRTSAP